MASASAAFKSISPAEAQKLEPEKAAQRAARIPERFREFASKTISEAAPDLWSRLTSVGQDMLVDEVLHAYFEKKPAKAVLQAWYRTLTLRQDTNREKHHEEAKSTRSQKPVTSSEELRERLGL